MLGLAQSGRWAEVEYNKIRQVSKIKKANKALVEKAYEIHTSVGLAIMTTKEMELLADEWQIQIHCFDINGVLSYHSQKRLKPALFIWISKHMFVVNISLLVMWKLSFPWMRYQLSLW